MNLNAERDLFIGSNIVSAIKFDTLEFYYLHDMIVFKDTTLNLMWHSWVASAQTRR